MGWLNKLISFNVLTAVIVVLALVLRLLAIHMYDVHLDELIYRDYARAFASGHFPNYYTFFLHPPGYYTFLTIWRTLFIHGQDMFTQITILRGFNIMISGFTVLLIILTTKLVTKKTIAWIDANVPPKSTICTFVQGEWLLKEQDFNVCSWHTLSEIKAHHVQYIIDPEKLTQANYGIPAAKDIAEIKPESKVVFDYTSRDSGQFLILEISNNKMQVQ